MKTDYRRQIEQRLAGKRADEIRTAWLASLSQALGSVIGSDSLLACDTTRRLKSLAHDKLAKAGDALQRFNWSKEDSEGLSADLVEMATRADYMPVVLFSSVDHLLGGVRVTAYTVLANAMHVWRVVGEDLCIVTEDLNSGLCLEENYYDLTGQYVKDGVYELNTWGVFSMPPV